MMLKKNIAVSDSGFLFDPLTGNSFSANGTGLQIVKYLQQGLDTAGIKESILKKYEVDPRALEKDLEEFMNTLGRLKLAE